MVDKCCHGFNGTIFAYGQTGSGKTFTMFGPPSISSSSLNDLHGGQDGSGVGGSADEEGIVWRVLRQLFESELIEEVKMSFLEIYCEEIYDLLNYNTSQKIHVRQTGEGIVVSSLMQRHVKSIHQARQLISSGLRKRSTTATSAQLHSSRSHAILQLTCLTTAGQQCKLSLVDLAGSERLKKTRLDTHGSGFQEAIKINSGLLALANVIRSLTMASGSLSQVAQATSSNLSLDSSVLPPLPGKKNSLTTLTASNQKLSSQQHQHVPYRQSKLTRFLQDGLGGNSITLMIACISPSFADFAESLNTVAYAARARNIRNVPSVLELNLLKKIDNDSVMMTDSSHLELAQHHNQAQQEDESLLVDVEHDVEEEENHDDELSHDNFSEDEESEEEESDKDASSDEDDASEDDADDTESIKHLKKYADGRSEDQWLRKYMPQYRQKTIQLVNASNRVTQLEQQVEDLAAKFNDACLYIQQLMQAQESSVSGGLVTSESAVFANTLERQESEVFNSQQKKPRRRQKTNSQNNNEESIDYVEYLKLKKELNEARGHISEMQLNQTEVDAIEERYERQISKQQNVIERLQDKVKDLAQSISQNSNSRSSSAKSPPNSAVVAAAKDENVDKLEKDNFFYRQVNRELKEKLRALIASHEKQTDIAKNLARLKEENMLLKQQIQYPPSDQLHQLQI